MGEQIINYDPSNEQILLSSAIVSIEARRKIVLALKEENFIGTRHKVMFRTFKMMVEQNLDYNEDTFKSLANGEFGGYKYLRKLQDAYEENPNIDKHINLQIENSVKHIIKTKELESLQRLLDNPEKDLNDISDHIFKISQKCKIANLDNQILKGKELKNRYLRDIRKRILNKDFVGFGNGELDEQLTEGAMRKKIVIIAGRPSMGKTTYVVNALKHWRQKNLKVLVCALESGKEAMLDAIISGTLRIPLPTIIKSPERIEAEQMIEIRQLLDKLLNDELLQFWDDEIPLTLGNINKICQNNNYDIVVIDLFEKLQDVYVDGKERNIDSKLDDLQIMAKNCDTCMVITSQIKRLGAISQRTDAQDLKPTLESIKNAGKYEEVADLIIFLHRAHYYNSEYPDVIEQIIAKQRRGIRNTSVYNVFDGMFATVGRSCEEPIIEEEGFDVNEEE